MLQVVFCHAPQPHSDSLTWFYSGDCKGFVNLSRISKFSTVPFRLHVHLLDPNWLGVFKSGLPNQGSANWPISQRGMFSWMDQAKQIFSDRTAARSVACLTSWNGRRGGDGSYPHMSPPAKIGRARGCFSGSMLVWEMVSGGLFPKTKPDGMP